MDWMLCLLLELLPLLVRCICALQVGLMVELIGLVDRYRDYSSFHGTSGLHLALISLLPIL